MTEGRVAKILNEYQLVLNIGTDVGLRLGDRFVVFERGEEVIDPSTGLSLGQLEAVKATVYVAHLQRRMCLVESPPKVDAAAALGPSNAPRGVNAEERLIRAHEPLDVLRAEISATAALRPIRVGDHARRVASAHGVAPAHPPQPTDTP